jgi:alkanesulfonate monooxygenase
MTASMQRATGGRLLYNIINGGGGPAQLWWGDKVNHADRYAGTSEFLDVLKGVWDAYRVLHESGTVRGSGTVNIVERDPGADLAVQLNPPGP